MMLLTKPTNKNKVPVTKAELHQSFGKIPSKTFQKKLNEDIKSSIGKVLIHKILRKGEFLWKKFPLKKILPVLKKQKNNNFLSIIFYVKKFIKNLQEKTFQKKFKQLTSSHFALINDNCRIKENHLFGLEIESNIYDEHLILQKVFFFFKFL